MSPVPTKRVPTPPFGTWHDVIKMFLWLVKLESKEIRLQVLKLVDALHAEALDVFRIGRGLERNPWAVVPSELTHPEPERNDLITRLRVQQALKFKNHGRGTIATRLRAKFASEHVDLANTDTLDEKLDGAPQRWYRQGALLLDCAETLSTHVAIYEYQLNLRRRNHGGRSPSAAHNFLAEQQLKFKYTDEQVTQSLVEAGFILNRPTLIANYQENVIKKHRLRRLERDREGR